MRPGASRSGGHFGHTRIGQILSLASQYWAVRGAWPARITLAMLLLAEGGGSLLGKWFSDLQKSFFDSLTARDAGAFRSAAIMSVLAITATATVGVISLFARQVLQINWRKSMTADLVGRWMRGHVPYRIERDRAADNADQRIAEDVRLYCESALTISISGVGALVSLYLFSGVLWRNSGSLDLDLGRMGAWRIHGYLFFVAVIWAVIQTSLTHLAGHKIAGITVAQQKAEADFRFALAKVREGAEQIALYAGDIVERDRFRVLFGPIRANWYQLLVQNLKLTFMNLSFGVFASIVPYLASAPKVMSGEMSVGTMMQNSIAFSMVIFAASWIATTYSQLVVFSAVVQRLVGLRSAIEAKDPPGIETVRVATPSISTERLQLSLPGGASIAWIGDVAIRPGERVLLAGPTGSGKSTLLRAIAGLWPFGRGRIVIPSDRRVMMLPQKSYIADGTLKEAVAYPILADEVDDESCRRVLEQCELGHLVDRLHEAHRWGHLLSGGEQQKLAFARALLYRPDILFMDEATSALDEGSEGRLYSMLCESLAGCTFVCVAHRRSLDRFHDRRVEIGLAHAMVAT